MSWSDCGKEANAADRGNRCNQRCQPSKRAEPTIAKDALSHVMHHLDQVEQIRQQVRSHFADLGATPWEGLQETILIRDGHYCGRRFRLDDFHATWFVEENEIKVYGRDGGVLCVLSPAPTTGGDDQLVA